MTCQRAGCAGTIVEGYCDTCGRAPAGAAPAAANSASGRASATAKPGTSSVRAGGTQAGSARGSASASASTSGRGSYGSAGSSRSGTGSSRRGSHGTTRRSLGAGLITLPSLPTMDPLLSVLSDPAVPEGKRYCPNCNAKLNLVKGFCPMCGTEYSFIPTLKPGAIVAGQYEVKGAIAFGGLGWIYLGWDAALSRWVVLKGLLNSKDAAGAQAAVAERQFLAAVKHPNIVGVYNFVSEGSDGYIVMEYVGGKTLKTIRKERGPLPVAEAIAYTHRILLAFGYLERMGMVYCDFKPDNFMVEEDDVKLIDMGGVRRVDDMDGDVYGTRGYSAPEAKDAPSFTSDLYTVARTLAILVADFSFQGSKYEFALPPAAEVPAFAQNDALYRTLLKATRKNPEERFQSADEMAAQLIGVLRETVAADGTPRLVESTQFSGDDGDSLEGPAILGMRALPAPKPDPLDPAAGIILAAAVATDPDVVAAHFERAIAQFPESVEAPLLLARARIDQGNFVDAERLLKGAEANDPFDWQVAWLRGVAAFERGEFAAARKAFDGVYGEVPGELAPKLALACAAEAVGDTSAAIELYDHVSQTDPLFTSAAFGLARCKAKSGDRAGAVEAYARIPVTSRRYAVAQTAMARVLVSADKALPALADLELASQTVQALAMEGLERHQLSVDLLRATISQVESKTIPAGGTVQVLGQPLESKALRFAVERELRACARFAPTREEKIALIDAANRERPRTLV